MRRRAGHHPDRSAGGHFHHDHRPAGPADAVPAGGGAHGHKHYRTTAAPPPPAPEPTVCDIFGVRNDPRSNPPAAIPGQNPPPSMFATTPYATAPFPTTPPPSNPNGFQQYPAVTGPGYPIYVDPFGLTINGPVMGASATSPASGGSAPRRRSSLRRAFPGRTAKPRRSPPATPTAGRHHLLSSSAHRVPARRPTPPRSTRRPLHLGVPAAPVPALCARLLRGPCRRRLRRPRNPGTRRRGHFPGGGRGE